MAYRYKKEIIRQARDMYYACGNASRVAKELCIPAGKVHGWRRHYEWAETRKRMLRAAYRQKVIQRKKRMVTAERSRAKKQTRAKAKLCTCCGIRPIADGYRFLCRICWHRNGDAMPVRRQKRSVIWNPLKKGFSFRWG